MEELIVLDVDPTSQNHPFFKESHEESKKGPKVPKGCKESKRVQKGLKVFKWFQGSENSPKGLKKGPNWSIRVQKAPQMGHKGNFLLYSKGAQFYGHRALKSPNKVPRVPERSQKVPKGSKKVPNMIRNGGTLFVF